MRWPDPLPKDPSPVTSRRFPRRPAPAPQTLDVTITAVGARGDGVAEHGGVRLYVPLTLAGERVRVRAGLGGGKEGKGEGVRAELLEILEPSPSRTAPSCGHFGVCGGCTLQHMADDAYAAWTVEQVRTVLERVGLGHAPLHPLARTAPHGRRRARFAALKRGKRVWLGFNGRQSHRVADLSECPVIAPALLALLAPARELLAEVLPDGGACDLMASVADGGIDLLLVGPPRLDRRARERLAAFAETHQLARVAWQAEDGGDSEPVAHRGGATIRFGSAIIEPAPGAFQQASDAGQAALTAAVLEAVGTEPKRVLDLFAGLGTFTFPLAERGTVHAVEGDAAALAALARGAANRRITWERRDLFTDPLTVKELDRFDAVVFDPPRAGAAAQTAALAASAVPLVVGVSCSPATFARDARTLADGGYRLTHVVPVDQFLWAAHVELVGVFVR